MHHAHIDISLLDARPPKTDILDDRHDALEQEGPEELHGGRLLDVFDAFIDGQAHHFEHFARLEAVTHQIAGLDEEFLALIALGIGQGGIVIAQ